MFHLVTSFRLKTSNMIPGSIGMGCLPIFLSIGLAAATAVNSELKMLHVLFRHGDRTPDNNGYEMYPNDPYLNYTFYPMGLGQLTNAGKKREYQIGEMLREEYGDFVGTIYSPSNVSGISSDYDRTKMSLQLVLAGLYPPGELQRWHTELDWQPVSTRYLSRLEDNLFLSDECPLFKAEYQRVLNSPLVRMQLSRFDDLMMFLTEKTGRKISTPLDMFYLYHTLVAESSMGLPLPDWAYDVFPYGDLWNATIFSYRVGNYNQRLRRLYGGPYIRTINEIMKGYASGSLEDPRRIYLHSGHETNIASVLYALGLYYPHVPEYSSSIITELRQINGEHYVKVRYYTGIPPRIRDMQLPGCDDPLCPLERYLQLTARVTPSDRELLCEKRLTTDYQDYRTRGGEETMTYNLIGTAINVDVY